MYTYTLLHKSTYMFICYVKMIIFFIQEGVQIIYYVTKKIAQSSYRACKYILQPRIKNRECEMNEIIEMVDTLQHKLKEFKEIKNM